MLVYNDGGVTNLRPKKFHVCCARWCFYSKSLGQFLLIPMYNDPQIPTSMKLSRRRTDVQRLVPLLSSFYIAKQQLFAIHLCVFLFPLAKQHLFAFHFCVFSFLLRSNVYLRFTFVCLLFCIIANQPLFACHFCVFPFSAIAKKLQTYCTYGTRP